MSKEESKPAYMISHEVLGVIIQILTDEHMSYETLGRIVPKLSQLTDSRKCS